MKSAVALIFLFLFAVAGALADDQLRTVQQALNDQGFYNGQVDGQPGNDTSAAIKRYQIRNGLEVTGQINPETLAAMNLDGNAMAPAQTAPVIQPKMPGTENAPGNDLKNQQPAASPPPVPSESADNPYPAIFQRTPYENAPGEVQQSTLKRAQMILNRKGYYRGLLNGVPGDRTTDAILRYQADEGLSKTGRLDMDTLANLDLLPRSGPARSADPEEPVQGRPVYRGIWVH